MPEESHERRYYQSFRPFSPFSDAEALEDGEAARRLGLSADSAAVPLQGRRDRFYRPEANLRDTKGVVGRQDKLNGSAQEALNQIKDKGCAKPYAADSLKVIALVVCKV